MGEVIIVASGKGGVGKTNTVVNLGIALSELDKSVALIDGSLTTPDISLHLGIPLHVRGLTNILKEKAHVESAIFNHKSGLRIIPGNVHGNVLKEFEGKKFATLLDTLKKEHDYVLIDCAAGLGREALSAIKHSDKMLIVANPELASVANASKTIQQAKDFDVEPIGIILNRIGRHKQELTEKEMRSLFHKLPIIGRIPEDTMIAIANKNSEAIINFSPKSKPSKEFKLMARNLTGEEKRTFWKKFKDLFKRG
jgi:septum site-determining protein MinD